MKQTTKPKTPAQLHCALHSVRAMIRHVETNLEQADNFIHICRLSQALCHCKGIAATLEWSLGIDDKNHINEILAEINVVEAEYVAKQQLN